VENKWRAQRYGSDCILVTEQGPLTGQEMLSRLLEQLAPHAEALGCSKEVERCRDIMRFGTSADQQLKIFRESNGDFGEVMKWIVSETGGQAAAAQPPFFQAVC
jgi:glutamate---cysteine ligase / carboxylate-amine ligase